MMESDLTVSIPLTHLNIGLRSLMSLRIILPFNSVRTIYKTRDIACFVFSFDLNPPYFMLG